MTFILSVVLIPILAYYFDIFREDPSTYYEITNVHNYGIKGIVFYLFLMPNVALYSGYFITGCTQAWSVGVEEQFYIIWPILILMFNKNKIIKVFWVVLVVVPFFIFFAKNDYIPYPFSVIIKCIPFHFMAIGAIGGYFFFYKKELVERYTISKRGYFLTISLILALLFYPFFKNEFQEICISFLFLFLILFTINDANPGVFKNQYFSYLGKISYGIYMYHTFIMFLIFPIINKYIFPFCDGTFYNLTLLLLIPSLTIGVSSFSYMYFEFRFIKIKDAKFKIV
jgi:peptidoglycan/LPS O-acetylase OafA/YrhL